MEIEKHAPFLFAEESFAIVHRELVNQYIAYRVHGYHNSTAFRRVFGAENYDSNSHLRIENLEHNPYYRREFARQLKAIQVEELWNTKIALNELLGMARNVFAKDTSRLAAMKELNIMCGITVTDENGKTKAGRSLDDFYKMANAEPKPEQTPDPTKVH